MKAENRVIHVYELVIVKRYIHDPPTALAKVFKGVNDYDRKVSLFVDWVDWVDPVVVVDGVPQSNDCGKPYNVATEYVADTQRGWLSHPVPNDREVLDEGQEEYTHPQRTHLWLDSESLEAAFGPATAERRDTTIEVWCGPRPYTYKDADGNDQKANKDSREVGKATIEFPDTPPAPPEPEPAETHSADVTLRSLTLSDLTLAFDPATTHYTAEVANDVSETTVTPTTNDDGATYAVKLDGAVDDDGVIPLAVSRNTITIEVTAEDRETTRTYTVSVTRAEAPPEPEPTPEPAPTSPPDAPDAPAGEVTGEGQVRLDWNNVEDASYYQVRFCCGGADWVTLPTGGIEVVFDGSRATVSDLPDYGIYYFSVRAGNGAGVSEWSDYLTLSNAD